MGLTLVLGIGNSLLTDDGVGIHAALRLREALGDADDVQVLDAGTLSFFLLPWLERADALIAFDAAVDGGVPGDLVLKEGADFDAFVRRPGRSVHEIGLADLLDMARLADKLPARRVLIGVEPASTDWGLECTPAVAATVPRCVDLARRYVEDWRAAPVPIPVTAHVPGPENAHAV